MVSVKKCCLILLFVLIASLTVVSIYNALFKNQYYFIVDNDIRSYCEIYDDSATLVQGVALGYCNFFDNGDAVGKTDKGLTYYSNGVELWSKSVKIHHDIELSQNQEEILLTCYELEDHKVIIQRYECVKVFDRNGNEKFSWSFKNQAKNLSEQLGVPLVEVIEFEKSLNKKVFKRSHLNFAYEIRFDDLNKIHPAFSKGNILVSDALNQCIFIIGRESGNVEWALSLKNQINDGPHTPFMQENGNIIFFVNTLKQNGSKKSGLGFYDINKQTYSFLDTFSSDWHSQVRSSVYPVNRNEYLITFSASKTAVIVDDSGTILRSIFGTTHSPKNLSDSMLYRVRAQNKNAVDQYIKKIGI